MNQHTKKSLNAAICCLDYVQVDLAELGMEKAVYHLERAIEEIARALPSAADSGMAAEIVDIDIRRREGP